MQRQMVAVFFNIYRYWFGHFHNTVVSSRENKILQNSRSIRNRTSAFGFRYSSSFLIIKFSTRIRLCTSLNRRYWVRICFCSIWFSIQREFFSLTLELTIYHWWRWDRDFCVSRNTFKNAQPQTFFTILNFAGQPTLIEDFICLAYYIYIFRLARMST